MTYTDIQNERYFLTLIKKKNIIEIMSKNTGHTWKIEDKKICFDLSHSHAFYSDYHYQTSFGTLVEAIDYIKEHDIFQLGGRKRSRKKPAYALNIK